MVEAMNSIDDAIAKKEFSKDTTYQAELEKTREYTTNTALPGRN